MQVICYPRIDHEEFDSRLDELRKIGIKELHFIGKQKIGNVDILGKGCVGIVIAARLGSRTVALKIRRTDANRITMIREANMLTMANSVEVGPKLLGVSENFLVMELLEGELIEEWFTHRDLERDSLAVKRILCSVLEQCFRLDRIGLDHGELSQARKHIIIDEIRPRIIDFETASTTRKPGNLSSLCQYLFISSPVSQLTEKILGKVDLTELKESLATYKYEKSENSYHKVLRVTHLL